jgi:hypothetical protein
VNHWKALIALLLALLYVPATCHCLLEDAGLIHRSECCVSDNATDDHGHDAADGICQVESASFVLPQPAKLAAKFIPVFVAHPFEPYGLLSSERLQPDILPCATSPPGLQAGWQFSHRTALPPRAPSVIS